MSGGQAWTVLRAEHISVDEYCIGHKTCQISFKWPGSSLCIHKDTGPEEAVQGHVTSVGRSKGRTLPILPKQGQMLQIK